jgi:hypothetical protein
VAEQRGPTSALVTTEPPPAADPAFERALAQAVAETGLDPVWSGNVRELHTRIDEAWRGRCCGSNCDPCVLTLARAVDRLRELLPLA